MATLPAGWSIQKVRTLGARRRAGGEFFQVGHSSQIRGVPIPGRRDWGLLITNELGDLRLYANLPSEEPEEVPLLCGDEAAKAARIGYSSTGIPGQYRYMGILPRGDGAWDLIDSHWWSGKLELFRKHAAGPEMVFRKPEQIGTLWGIPELIDWRRDGRHDLLVGTQEGKLLRMPRTADAEKVGFGDGVPVQAQVAPIEFAGPVFPCVVDWEGKGRSDLLVGTGDGEVFLFQDVGQGEVEFARGRQLVSSRGFVTVKGPACPTVVMQGGKRHLLVADGDGVVWWWPIEQTTSYVTTDLFAALGGEAGGVRPGYERGQWWLLRDGTGPIVAAAPERIVAQTEQEKVERKAAVFDPPAPEIGLTPPVGGFCEVHVTFRTPDMVKEGSIGELHWSGDTGREPILKARLSDEKVGMVLQPGELHRGRRQEVFFKAADLTGRRIHLKQMEGFLTQEGGLPAYVESVRVTPLKSRPNLRGRKRVSVAGIADAVDWYLAIKVNTPEEVDEMVEQHRISGMDLIYYKLGGGCWEYPSRIPEARSVVPDLPTMNEHDKAWCARRIETQESVNRVQLVVEACHRRGMQCYGWMRVQNHGERIFGKGPLDRFYVEHPEFLEKNLDGSPVSGKLCLGYPEVRAFHVALIEEAMEFGCDGILMDTMRHLPKVMYGDPVVEEFRTVYGLDMRRLPPMDERVMELQVGIFTRFLREVREAMLKKKGDAQLHVRVCRAWPLMGCDPGLWAREGIADEILIEDRKYNMSPDVAGLAAAVKGTRCAASGSFTRTRWGAEKMPLHAWRIRTETNRWLKAGSKRLVFYETAGICDNPELSRAMRAINDPNELPSRVF